MIVPSDIETAVVSQWAAASLDTNVPGGIRLGRRVDLQPGGTTDLQQPYAVVDAKLKGEPQFYTEGAVAGSPYHATFEAKVTIYGVGAAAVGGLIRTVATGIGTAWTVAGGTFQHAYPVDVGLVEDPDRKQGEDWWQGSITYAVTVSGTL